MLFSFNFCVFIYFPLFLYQALQANLFLNSFFEPAFSFEFFFRKIKLCCADFTYGKIPQRQNSELL